MSAKPYASRRDGNEPEIIKALEKHGAWVVKLSIQNVPDLLVGYGGKNYLMEVKMPDGELSTGQQEFLLTWTGETHVVYSKEDALQVLGIDT